MMNIISWLMANGPEMLSSVIALLSALIAISLMIPGKQPEKALQYALDLLKKLSKK